MSEAGTGKALLYARVSTAMQVNDGVSLDVQERQLITAAEFHGFEEWDVIREEGKSGKNIKGRPVLQKALKDLESKEADALIVTRIDRLARSTSDFLSIVDVATKHGWRLILLDLNLDTSSYQGRFVTTVMSALAEMERGIIAERQKDVHKDRRAQGIVWGKDMGPMNRTPQELKDRILSERSSGRSYREIASRLNNEEIPTQNGKSWYATTVKNILDRISGEKT
jgi:DNA invertase Pin-like site-specific DNA recombinase|tara:strand:- start:3675 stop:4349 length:675 start_codon:yes stop_codon:yes gene_type:complete